MQWDCQPTKPRTALNAGATMTHSRPRTHHPTWQVCPDAWLHLAMCTSQSICASSADLVCTPGIRSIFGAYQPSERMFNPICVFGLEARSHQQLYADLLCPKHVCVQASNRFLMTRETPQPITRGQARSLAACCAAISAPPTSPLPAQPVTICSIPLPIGELAALINPIVCLVATCLHLAAWGDGLHARCVRELPLPAGVLQLLPSAAAS